MVALGRRLEHDPRSRRYPARRVTQPRSVLWTHTAPVLDQGDLGSCTGNALAQCLNTTKFARSRPKRKYLDERAAVDLYSVATDCDEFPDNFPPVDSGSSGLGVAKAGVRLGYLSGYQHAFGFDHFLSAIQLSPVIVGTNWYDSMWDTDSRGYLHVDKDIVGGHEWLVIGANLRDAYITAVQSWGPNWGNRGRFRLSFSDFQRLLNEDGDVTVPIGKA